MKLNNKQYPVQNSIQRLSILVFAILTFASCCKDDGPNNQVIVENQEETKNTIYGQWKVTSGNLSFGESKFIRFNTDNTLHLLEENDEGFKSDLVSAIVIEKDSITIVKAEQGLRKIGYQFEVDKLVLSQEFGSNVRLERVSEIPSGEEWIKTLSVLDKGNSAQQIQDITFDGDHILASSFWENKIQKIDPRTFESVGSIDAELTINAIDMEKSDHELRQLFKSYARTEVITGSGFSSYIYRSNEPYYSSNGISSTITGLASEKPGYVWAAGDEDSVLYYYKSNGSLSPGEILKAIPLNFRPAGLHYRDGFLYILTSGYIYKCNVTDEFQVTQTFKIPGFSFSGITHDGDDFILSAYNQNGENYTFLRTTIPD